MKAYSPLILSGLIAIANWVIVARQRSMWDWVTKPGVILALLASLYTLPSSDHLVFWFGVGLSLSLIGDIFLLFPSRFFLLGLGTFLLAHIAYVIAFNRTFPPLTPPIILLLIAMTGLTSLLYIRLSRALIKKGQQKYLLPTLLYALSITGMSFSSLSTLFRPNWTFQSSLLASWGGLSFFLSDAILAWHRFIAPVTHRNIKVRLTYHLGQICLVWGVILHTSL